MFRALRAWVRRSINYELKKNITNGSLILPVIYNVGRAHLDPHEPHILPILKRLYSPGTILIDVGVNIGQTLVKFASVAGVGCRYVGFEPNIRASNYVDEIIIRNGMQNSLVVPVGLGSHTRLAKLLLATAGSTDPAASINQRMRDPDFYGAEKVIAVFNGDQALGELGLTEGRFIFKIDVEGAELEVLSGFTETIEKLRPFIILELLPSSNFSADVNDYRITQIERIKQLMSGYSYVEHAIGLHGELIAGESPTNDYLFVPSERLNEAGIEQ